MKNREIKNIFDAKERLPLVESLCEVISITYSIKAPTFEFLGYLSNTLKKHYGHLTFAQIESAFEYNSMGYLNQYLPKSGMSIDNKVKFTIPDIIKVINAFSRYKKINAEPDKENSEKDLSELNEIRKTWCDNILQIFEYYKQTKQHKPITIPVYTCEVLAKLGLLDKERINYVELRINPSILSSKPCRKLNNENLIYETFDNIISKGESLELYINEFKHEFEMNTNSLPF